MLITIGIVLALLKPALEFFQEVSVCEFLTGTKWAPRFKPPAYGVLPLVTATLWTTGIALLVAVPFGLGGAVYLAEYARDANRKRAQADARAPRRHPVGRVRLLRPRRS